MHIIAAKAVAFGEALQPEFKEYIQNVVDNTKTLANVLIDKQVRIITDGTDNHLFLIDTVKSFNLTGKEAEKLLDEVGITTNKNTIPFDNNSPFVTSGVRIGTAAITTRGFKILEMYELADVIVKVLKNPNDEAVKEYARDRVIELCAMHPIYS